MPLDIPHHNKENIRDHTPLNRSNRRRGHRVSAGADLSKSGSSHGKIGNRGRRRSSPRVALPKRLPPPPVNQAIDVADIAAISPSLANVPLHYVRDTLKKAGPDLLRAVTASKPIPPTGSGLPSKIQVETSEGAATRPTHVFAVHSSHQTTRSTTEPTRVLLFAAHDLVFAALTAKVKRLPRTASESLESQLTMPLVPLCIPSPGTFSLLQSYLYLRQPKLLLTMLLPMPTLPTEPSPQDSARLLAATFTVNALLNQATKVHGLWGNGIALGVDDTEFWAMLDHAWISIVGALALRTRQRI